MLTIPGPNAYPYVDVKVPLSGATYRITWQWNERDRCWYFSMRDPSDDLLVSSVRVVTNVDLLMWVPISVRRPPYSLLVLDPMGQNREPGFDTLGREIKVVYTEPAEDAP